MSSITAKWLMLILSSVMAAVSADGSHFHLSGSLNVEKYETADMKHRLLLKHNTSRREVSSMFVKEDSEDKRQYENEEIFNKDNGDAYTRKDSVWIFPLTVLGGSRFANRSYIVYAVAGETFTIRSWSLNDTTLSFAIKQGDMVRLNASFKAGTYEIIEDKKNRVVLKQNLARREVSLIFDNVGNEDEGQYVVEENYDKSYGDTYAKKDGAWIFRLNVLKPDEIKRGNVGENIIILQLKNKPTSSFARLYHYDHVVTVLKETGCDINSTSHFYGRLQCKGDKAENRYRIELRNVEKKDTGLYRVNADGNDTARCFLNITDLTATTKSISIASHRDVESFSHATSSVSVIGTTVASRLNTITIQYSTEAFYYSQLSTDSLSATANLSSSENTSNPSSVPIYIIPIIVGSVGGIILIICCRRRIKRNMTYSLEGGANSIRS